MELRPIDLDRFPLDTLSARQSPREISAMLASREEFYRTILDSLAEGVMITNSESRIIFANKVMQEVTGYSSSELVGQISYRLLSPKQNWSAMERRLAERLSGKVEEYEHELIRKDGSVAWIAVRATPYRNAQGDILGTVGAISCIERRKSLEQENEYLLDEIRGGIGAGTIIGQSPSLKKVLEQIQVVAPTCANVLILGESGTGKELIAQAIHDNSDRRKKTLVRVNCASIPKDLFESEFFGHVRGAFTGAVKDRVGRFDLANGGTLFLDEVGEIPLELQGKLLRVLQEGTFERLGEERTRKVNVRVIAATNRDLLAEAKQGRFRMDLYYRLSVFPIQLDSLRDRKEDIIPLAEYFLQKAAVRSGVPVPRLTLEHRSQLENYPWPGNIRELQNVIERSVILSRLEGLKFNLEPAPHAVAGKLMEHPVNDLAGFKTREREILVDALTRANWKIYGKAGAAALLGIPPTTLASKIKKWKILR
ncbi:MAG: DNA-binding protein Fis / transcriptional regulator, Fis family [Verrucomicrobiales bacterium]|nr:DNA-binding protein Fis / transcriptional regulator, Fis family [Verrucomicrobiales bacterium]